MKRLGLVFVLLLLFPIRLMAQTPDASVSAEFERIITDQIEAFKSDDGLRAYGHAAPMIQKVFPTPEVFMDMVRKGYRPVYRPQSYKFGETTTDQTGRPAQKVMLVGPDGLTYEALYTFEQQPDGTWLINGCYILPVKSGEA
jgi:hypothetical protein